MITKTPFNDGCAPPGGSLLPTYLFPARCRALTIGGC